MFLTKHLPGVRVGFASHELSRERLIKVGMPHHYFRHNRVRVVLNNLLTYSMLTNSLRAPLSYLGDPVLTKISS